MSATKKELIQVNTYSRRLRDNVKSILDNYSEILKASIINVDDQTQRIIEAQVAHTENEIVVRAANIVRAAESLSKLVSDLKENLILNDFSSINEIISQRTNELNKSLALQRKELLELYAKINEERGGATSTDEVVPGNQN